jgi:hypothetical protein
MHPALSQRVDRPTDTVFIVKWGGRVQTGATQTPLVNSSITEHRLA